MLQSLNPLQDENSQPYRVKGLQDNVARLGSALGKTPVGKTPFAKTGLGSTRKALGNITNRPSNLQDAAIPRSATKAPLTQRKTLGDITNTPAKAAANLKPALQKPAQQKHAAVRTQAELYAQDGIEKLAGKGKQQLDLEREARDLAEIRSKAAYIASLPALRPPQRQHFQVTLWNRQLAACCSELICSRLLDLDLCL